MSLSWPCLFNLSLIYFSLFLTLLFRYGPSAANVAAGTFDTIGNTFIVSQNVNYITPKGIAKKMAKNTGKAVVQDYKKNLREESHYVPAGVLYPDLTGLKEKHLK